MRRIYTTEKIHLDGVEVLGVERLSPEMRAWVRTNRRELLSSATLPERVTAMMLSKFDEKPIRQAFFMIRKRCYFLDFFFPRMTVAVEIDGASHTHRKDRDKRRDADFRSIGIRTIRISNRDVMSGKLYDKLFKRLYR